MQNKISTMLAGSALDPGGLISCLEYCNDLMCSELFKKGNGLATSFQEPRL